MMLLSLLAMTLTAAATPAEHCTVVTDRPDLSDDPYFTTLWQDNNCFADTGAGAPRVCVYDAGSITCDVDASSGTGSGSLHAVSAFVGSSDDEWHFFFGTSTDGKDFCCAVENATTRDEAAIYGSAQADMITLSAYVDEVSGYSGSRAFPRHDLDDLVEVWAGDGADDIDQGGDPVCGTTLDIDLHGGDGADTIEWSSGCTDVFGEADGDTLTVAAGAATNGQAFGGAGDDDFNFDTCGTSATGTFAGGAGSDTFDLTACSLVAPVIYGDTTDTSSTVGAADTIDCGDADCEIYGGPGDDIITTGDGANLVNAGTGDDTVTGGANADVLCGGDGTDSLYGSGGDDELFGQAGSSDLADGGTGSTNICNAEIESLSCTHSSSVSAECL